MVRVIVVGVTQHKGTFIVPSPILRRLRNVANDFLTVGVKPNKPIKIALSSSPATLLPEEPRVIVRNKQLLIIIAAIFVILAEMSIEARVVFAIVFTAITVIFSEVSLHHRAGALAN